MKKFLISIVFLLAAAASHAQDFTPVVTQFNKRDYKADNQNWSVTYDDDGVVYFGNGNCLLSYDGIIWSKHNMPYNKIVRSVMADGNRIYAGSYEEFGYFEKKSDGRLVYTSISDLLTEYDMQNDEIWKILKVGDRIVFQSFTSYFIYDGEDISPFRASTVFNFFCKFGKDVYTDTNTEGLCTVDLETGELTKVAAPFRSSLISILDRLDGTAYFVTYSDGIYLFDGRDFRKFRTEVDEGLGRWQVNRAELSRSGDIIIGTLLNGAVSIDEDGKADWMVNTSNVLQSNTVLGMKFDMNGNLWFALDTGIAIIPAGNSLMYINSLYPGIGAVYTAHYEAPHLYMGTGQGLYRARMLPDFRNVSDIEIIPEIKGHVWDISEFDSQVFISTNTETYELLDNGGFKAVSPVSGGMCIAEGNIAGKRVLVQGTYTYLCIYVRENGKWVYSHSINDFMDPISTIAIDHTGSVWAGHMHRGMYKIDLNPDLKSMVSCTRYDSLGEGDFLPIRVYLVDGRMVFADTKNMYTYDYIEKKIVPYDDLSSRIGSFRDAYRICRSKYGSHWFITQTEAAKLDFEGGQALKYLM